MFLLRASLQPAPVATAIGVFCRENKLLRGDENNNLVACLA
jgi:hypothetical protein